jgi:hypothetical protein
MKTRILKEYPADYLNCIGYKVIYVIADTTTTGKIVAKQLSDIYSRL